MVALAGLAVHAQTRDVDQESEMPVLAFKLLLRARQPAYAPGNPITVEAACVSLPRASAQWQARWDDACAGLELEVSQARMGGYWGAMNTDWIENRLHLCRLPEGKKYEDSSSTAIYGKPQWHPITIPAQKLAGLRGLVAISARAVLKRGGEQLDQEFAGLVTAITTSQDDGTESGLSPDLERDGGEVQSGDGTHTYRLADELLESSTPAALRMAVRLFDNGERTQALWTFIENSPHQQLALDLMQARLLDPHFVPDYRLLVNLTGMKLRLDSPLEFEAAGKPPYPEYQPRLEEAAVAYFVSLVDLLVNSRQDPGAARKAAIAEIIASVAELDRCPLGTYGLSAKRASELSAQLRSK